MSGGGGGGGGGHSSGGGALSECCDTDLLDALLGTEEAGSTPRGELAAEGTSSHHKRSFPMLSQMFMIGGSLFSRRRMAAMSRSHATRLRGSHFSWLEYGSIYCPFTRQFVSMRSPHWAHLVSAGFGVDRGLHHGRRVVLMHQRRLQSLAKLLQGCQEAPQALKNSIKGQNPMAHWSPSLRHSLGALLETTPLSDGNVLAQRVQEVLDEENCGRMSRRIPLSLYDSRVRKHYTFTWSGNAPGRDDTIHDDEVHKDRMMVFGERCLEYILPWRVAVLQQRKKVTSQTGFPLIASPIVVPDLSSLLSEKAANLIERYSSLNSTPFMIPGCRMAYLSIAYEPKLPLMETAVDAVLRAHCSQEILYCPLEHCIDYNALTDVEAYRLQRDPNGTLQLRDGVPLLQVGMHANLSGDVSSGIVVVVSNAHFLSKRAIARLLDQWTRNGVAHSLSNCQRREGAGKRWGLLLGGSDPMRVLKTGTPLFGNVRALFIGCRPSNSFQESQGRTSVDGTSPLVHISDKTAVVRIHAPKPLALFSLDEPLVVAMQRVSSVFQDDMSVAERKSFIEELCKAWSRETFFSSGRRSTMQGTTYCNGGVVHSEDDDDDREEVEEMEEMLLQFQEACEAFLTQPSGKQDTSLLQYEQLLTRYPKFAAMRVQHKLLREYPLSIELSEGVGKQLVAAPPSSVVNSFGSFPSSTGRHITVLESRHMARESAERDHEALKKEYAMSVALRCSRDAHMPRCVVSTRCPLLKGTSEGTSRLLPPPPPPPLLLLEQKYDPFFEPPLLLGSWTKTFFFCAPMVADMLPLRRLLHRYVAASVELTGEFEVVDVDVFHVDYVFFPPDRRSRLFGARLRFRAATSSSTSTASPSSVGVGGCRIRIAATRALHHVLAKSAVEARLFPLWTFPLSNMGKRGCSYKYTVSQTGGNNASGSFEAHFQFEALDECVSAAQPNVVERWLFALAVAQRGSLRLTVGSQVVTLQDLSPCMARGTWCRVVGFVPFGEIARTAPHSSSAKLHQRQPPFSSTDILLAQQYFEQQRASNAVPVVCPIAHRGVGGAAACAAERVVLPVATLVGGYRSLHYYALPTVQLPLLAPCQCAAASTLFHPLFTHEDGLMEFVSMESRAEAIAMLLRPPTLSGSPAEGQTLQSFFEESVFEDQTLTDEALPKDCNERSVLHCDALSAISLFPSKRP